MSAAEQIPFIIITLLSVAGAIGTALWINYRDRRQNGDPSSSGNQ